MTPLPIQHDWPGGDPRIPVLRELRLEWMNRQRITPLLLKLEAQAKALTNEMHDARA